MAIQAKLNHPPSNIAYFNNAGKVPIPPSVQEAGQNALLQESNPWDQVQQNDQNGYSYNHLKNKVLK